MYVRIAPKCLVWITEQQLEFVREYHDRTFTSMELAPHHIDIAKVLADKCILVRKKLDTGVQYALNRHIKFVHNAHKK